MEEYEYRQTGNVGIIEILCGDFFQGSADGMALAKLYETERHISHVVN